MKKLIIMVLILIGIIYITIDITRNTFQCRQEKVIYKYIPRTFEDEQVSPVNVSDVFQTMFSQASPWVANITDTQKRQAEEINKYFVSQA